MGKTTTSYRIKAEEGFKLPDIIRDFKKFTAKEIISKIKTLPETRREWMFLIFFISNL